jgi:hypothetical protein
MSRTKKSNGIFFNINEIINIKHKKYDNAKKLHQRKLG